MEQDKRILINQAMEKSFEAISSAESNFQNKYIKKHLQTVLIF